MSFLKILDVWQWVAIAAVVTAIFLAGYANGVASEAGKQMDRVIEEANKAAKVIVKQGEVTVKVVTRYKDRIVVHEKIVEKNNAQLETLVPADVNAACRINAGFVRGWNDDNQDRVSEAAEGDLRADSAVTLRDIKAQHTRESSLTRQLEERLALCRDWVREQYELTNKEKLVFE